MNSDLIHETEIQRFSQLTRPLWLDRRTCQVHVLETVCALQSFETQSHQVLKRALPLLLKKADQERETVEQLQNYRFMYPRTPFLDLSPQQRVLLVALHLLRVSYQELAQWLGCSTLEVEQRAWVARIQMNPFHSLPQAPLRSVSFCPAYESDRPWTQRYLDDEWEPASEKLSLQNHILHCSSCERVLQGARSFYFHTQNQILASQSLFDPEELVQDLNRLLPIQLMDPISWRSRLNLAMEAPRNSFLSFSRSLRVLRWCLYFLLGAVLPFFFVSLFLQTHLFR